MLAPRPTPARPAPWSFPQPRTTRLDNGIELLTYHLPGQHVISATVVIDFSIDSEPEGRDGITSLLTSTMTEGTHDHPGERFAELLENEGAVMGADVGSTGIHALFDVPATRLTAAGPLFAEAVRRCALDDADVRRQVDLRLAELAQLRANSAATASTEFRRAVLASSSRFARPVGGDAEPVAGLDGGRVRDWYDRVIDPARATMIIGGDLPDDPTAMVSEWFGDWSSTATSPVVHGRPDPAAPTAIIIDRPGAVQADVRLGGFAIDRHDPRWPAVRVASYPMGGSFGSRLNAELREARGYTYGARLGFSPQRHGGWFALSGSFRTDVVGPALSVARELLDVSDAPFTDAEIADAQQYHLGSGPLHYATADGVVDQAATQVTLGLPHDYLDRSLEQVLAVTAGEATEAFASLVDPAALTLVVVGDAEALADPIRAAGFDARVV